MNFEKGDQSLYEAVVQEWRRLKDLGLRLHQERHAIAVDSGRLHQRFQRAADNFEKATVFLEQLDTECQKIRGLGSTFELERLTGLVRQHRLKRELFFQATLALYRTLRRNDAYLELVKQLAQQVEAGLQASLDQLRHLARGEKPPAFLTAEFRAAMGRLAHPAQVYREIEDRWRKSI